MRHEEVVWRAPHALWRDALSGATGFDRPALLRLAGDDFMEQVTAAVGTEGGLAPLVAGAETWREPGAGLGTAHERDDATPVTLFQPVHGRFYLVTAALVCRRYGHPDHAVHPDRGERVGMLLRRLVPTGDAPVDATDPGTFREHGWVPTGGAGTWVPVPDGGPAPGEERLALFPLTCETDGRRRLTWAGLLPAGRRETYEPPRVVRPGDVVGDDDPLAVLADTRLQPLESAVAGLAGVWAAGEPDEDESGAETALVRESLFFTLVDLAVWFEEHLTPELVAGLEALDANFTADLTWREAVGTARANETTLFEDGEPAPVAGLSKEEMHDAVEAVGVSGTGPVTDQAFFREMHAALAAADAAAQLVSAAVGAAATSGVVTLPAPTGHGVYVTRLLYERPRCGPADRVVLSAPSRPFRLGGFHDPDAPARPVRIPMPVDTSPGGLRKFPKNVSVVLSAELRRQMHQVSEKTLREGETETPPPAIGFGMICQLSIPIITICALLLLMVLVVILNLVFFWVPLFKICLPVPKEA
jgi:hypothetical protein